MLAIKVYPDCARCSGNGHYEGETDWGIEWITCIICMERYVIELRTLLYGLLVNEIPNALADKIVLLLQDRPLTPQERLDNAYRASEILE